MKDWKELGHEVFTYEVLEEKAADEVTDMRWELKQMESRGWRNCSPMETENIIILPGNDI
jgi:hypothetical protein